MKEEAKNAASQNANANKKDKKRKDPLHWFGVLVPSHLRQCQSDFKQGTLSSRNPAVREREREVDLRSHLADN